MVFTQKLSTVHKNTTSAAAHTSTSKVSLEASLAVGHSSAFPSLASSCTNVRAACATGFHPPACLHASLAGCTIHDHVAHAHAAATNHAAPTAGLDQTTLAGSCPTPSFASPRARACTTPPLRRRGALSRSTSIRLMREDAMKAALDVAMPRFDDTSTTSKEFLLRWDWHAAVPSPSVLASGDVWEMKEAKLCIPSGGRNALSKKRDEKALQRGGSVGWQSHRKGTRTKKTCTRRCENNKVVTSKASNHSNIYSRGPANKLTWVLVRIEGEAGDVSPASNVQLESTVSAPRNRPYKGRIPHSEHINTTSGSAPYACACN